MISVLKKYFNHELNQSSPVQKDYRRVSKVDENGCEHITFVEVDYPALQKSFGFADDWSLQNLVKAGINPDFQIATTFSTRLDAQNYLNGLSQAIDTLFPAEPAEPAVPAEPSNHSE